MPVEACWNPFQTTTWDCRTIQQASLAKGVLYRRETCTLVDDIPLQGTKWARVGPVVFNVVEADLAEAKAVPVTADENHMKAKVPLAPLNDTAHTALRVVSSP